MDKTVMKMKKIFKVIFCGMFFLIFCGRSNKADSKKWENHSPVKNDVYRKDSIRIIMKLQNDLINHKDFFSSKEYFDSTQIIIDTIIYDPNRAKLAVFIITKNPTSRQLMPDTRSNWYYNANCYLGIKKSQDSILLSSIGPVFTNSINRHELISIMRSEYFSIFAKLKNDKGELRYRYNLGDIRFWNCPIWNDIEDKELKRRLFEKEKEIHPENIYDKSGSKN